MQVELYQLRRAGEKLPREEIDGPHFGWLRVGRATIAGRMTMTAGLFASASKGAPPILDGLTDVALRSLDERGMLLLGIQVAPYTSARHRQAWWCVPVKDRPSGSTP